MTVVVCIFRIITIGIIVIIIIASVCGTYICHWKGVTVFKNNLIHRDHVHELIWNRFQQNQKYIVLNLILFARIFLYIEYLLQHSIVAGQMGINELIAFRNTMIRTTWRDNENNVEEQTIQLIWNKTIATPTWKLIIIILYMVKGFTGVNSLYVSIRSTA